MRYNKSQEMKLMEEAYARVSEQGRMSSDIYTRDADPKTLNQPTADQMAATPERDQYTYPREAAIRDYTSAQKDIVSDTFDDFKNEILSNLENPEVINLLNQLNDITGGLALIALMPAYDSIDTAIKGYGGTFLNQDLIDALNAGTEFDILVTDDQGRVVHTIPSEQIDY